MQRISSVKFPTEKNMWPENLSSIRHTVDNKAYRLLASGRISYSWLKSAKLGKLNKFREQNPIFFPKFCRSEIATGKQTPWYQTWTEPGRDFRTHRGQLLAFLTGLKIIFFGRWTCLSEKRDQNLLLSRAVYLPFSTSSSTPRHRWKAEHCSIMRYCLNWKATPTKHDQTPTARKHLNTVLLPVAYEKISPRHDTIAPAGGENCH